MFRRRVITFLVDQELLPRDRAEMLLSWQHSGFSLHRSRRVGLEEREDLEQIARYILRNPFSTAKMHFEPGAGSVLYRSRMNKKQGGNFAALSPTDFTPNTFPTKASSSCATTVGIPTRLGAFAPRRARRKPKTLLKAMSRIVRPPRPSGGGSSPRSGRPTR
jgi:Putative transposase